MNRSPVRERAPRERAQRGVTVAASSRSAPRNVGGLPYSAITSPEPPNSLGKSLSFGNPSFIGRTVS